MTKTSEQAIITEARELFRSLGYAGASMKELADKVGIRKASLYSRIDSKEAMVAQVLDLTLADIFDFAAEGMDWRQAYTTTIHRMAGHVRDHRRCVALHLAYGLPDDATEGRSAVLHFFAACRDRLSAMLQGGIDADMAEELAVDTITLIEGATLWLALSGDGSALDRAVATLAARAGALAIDTPSPAARYHLDTLAGGWRQASAAEKALAIRLADAEDRILFLEEALRGQIEAESCFR